MNWNRAIDWIWHVRGSVPLAHRSAQAAFEALAPVFEERGTTLDHGTDTLVFHKDNPDAQDRLASFEQGVLRIEDTPDGPVLRYDLTSHPLLWCFVAPAPFAALAFAVQSLRIQGYSFAGIFAALYLAGRWIEHRNARRVFGERLAGPGAIPAETAPA
ncbi:hypothetical protein [Sphingomonas azotifigens]|uniref:hypothetical protein n=1 Tax=Sphingomonas azotifigens TaxID=330920 RepID=UPI0009FC9D60|nr:hypothetical protein [Sphingomonas azotifigens]